MTRLLVLLLVGCTQTHAPAGAVEVSNDSCVTCHIGDYEAADDPVHVGNMPTTCDDCHSTEAWRPAGMHPEAAFPIRSGPHAGIECADCHDDDLGLPQNGANTDCKRCHPNSADLRDEHDDFPWSYDPEPPNFCLDCHPQGIASD